MHYMVFPIKFINLNNSKELGYSHFINRFAINIDSQLNVFDFRSSEDHIVCVFDIQRYFVYFSHNDICTRSSLIWDSNNWGSVPLENRLVSPAKRMWVVFLQTAHKSLLIWIKKARDLTRSPVAHHKQWPWILMIFHCMWQTASDLTNSFHTISVHLP